MYKIAICEDNIEQREYIKNLIIENNYFDNNEIEIFSSGENLLVAYESGLRFSIILLDMQMNGIDGIETAKVIRKYDKNVRIVIITSIIEYAVEGYGINASDFILKPIDVLKFNKVMSSVIEKLNKEECDVYEVQMRDITRFVKLSEVLYFESDRKKVRIHCSNEVMISNEGISEVEKRLLNSEFVRISRFYLVNMKYIKAIEVDEINLTDGTRLKYSLNFQKVIKESYMNFMMGDI